MCDPATAIGAASSIAGYAGQAQAANAANAASLANAQSASIAAGYKYADAGQKFIYDSKALQREANKAVLAGRAAVATGMASSGSTGVAGLSLGALVADTRRQAAENVYVTEEKRDDRYAGLITETKSYEAEAQGRINSMPMRSGPNPLGLAIELGTAGMKGGQNAGYWDAGFPT